MARQAALRPLIAGTPLQVRSDDGKTVVLGTGAPVPASASDPGGAGDPPTKDIVVTAAPPLEEERALEWKRKQIGTNAVMSGETIARRPGGNIVDILAVLPGVTAYADMGLGQAATGEAEFVSIRGIDSSYNAYTIIGMRVAEADPATRALSLKMIAPYGLRSASVSKTPDAAAYGDSIGGTVDIATPTGFQFGKRYFKITGGANYNHRARKLGFGSAGGAGQVEFGRTFGANDSIARDQVSQLGAIEAGSDLKVADRLSMSVRASYGYGEQRRPNYVEGSLYSGSSLFVTGAGTPIRSVLIDTSRPSDIAVTFLDPSYRNVVQSADSLHVWKFQARDVKSDDNPYELKLDMDYTPEGAITHVRWGVDGTISDRHQYDRGLLGNNGDNFVIPAADGSRPGFDAGAGPRPDLHARQLPELSRLRIDKGVYLVLGVYDPQRGRGWGGAIKPHITLAETFASPSYLAGPLPAGKWRLSVAVAYLKPGVIAPYTVRVHFDTGAAAQAIDPGVVKAGPGWYAGDFQTHTGNSDAVCRAEPDRTPVPCPTYFTLRAAYDHHLDFVVVTDHNTRSQNDAIAEVAPFFDRLLAIPGREMTTQYGHFNLIGITDFVDHRLASPACPTSTRCSMRHVPAACSSRSIIPKFRRARPASDAAGPRPTPISTGSIRSGRPTAVSPPIMAAPSMAPARARHGGKRGSTVAFT